MNRYFFYLIFINSINNIIIFLPRVLSHDRYHGALMSIFLALPYGTILLTFFSKAVVKFPNQGLPEILKATLPRWAQIMIMSFFWLPWYVAGLLMLSALVEMAQRFINPEMSVYVLLALFVAVFLFAIRTEGSTVLYALEVALFIIIPMIAVIFIKSITYPYFSWTACQEILTHSFTIPTLSSFAITTYMFTGYTDMFTFNRAFNKTNFQPKHLWLFPVLEFILLVFAFFIPIGFLGTQGVSAFNYPWITTSDCITLETGFTERTLFLYLPIFIFTAIVNIIVHWHVALELLKGLFEYQFNIRNTKAVTWFILALFGVIAFIFKMAVNEESSFIAGTGWLEIRVFTELLFVSLLVYAAYIAKKKGII